MGGSTKQNRFWILCVVLFCAVLLLVSVAAASTTASITITGVYKGVPPVAKFTAIPLSGIAPLNVAFDSSGTTGTLPLTYAWDFGDGGISSLPNPSHTYNAGTYTAQLTVSNAAGSSSATQPITATSPLTAAFTAVPSSGPYPLTVTFTDTSTGGTPTSWAWDFNNDGIIDSYLQNPGTFTYTSANTYYPKLTVSNGAGSDFTTREITVYPPLTASFTATQDCTTKLKVKFMSTYSGGPPTGPTTWYWNFGDGTSSNVQNPIQTYATAGTYIVKLTVTRGSESITVSKTITPGTLKASFSASPTSGTIPLTVSFTDTSAGIPTSWKWDFGDTTSSTVQNPVHTYTKAGTFTVKLTPGNSCSPTCTAATKTITVYPVLTVSSITPVSGNRGWTVLISNLAGTGFQPGATVKLTRTGSPPETITGTSVIVVSSSKITCSFDLIGATIGSWDVVVTNPDSKSASKSGFTVISNAPTISGSFTPSSGARGTTVTITSIPGTNFQPYATVVLTSGTTTIPVTVTSITSTKITGKVAILSGAPTGYYTAKVTNTDGKYGTRASAFKVT